MRRAPLWLAVVGAVSLAVTIVVFLFGASDPAIRAPIAALALTWAAGYALACSGLARRLTSGDERRAWAWIAAGCAALFVAQLALDYRQLVLRLPPPSVPLAELAGVVVAVCVALALRRLLPPHARRPELDVALDAGLVTFTAVALAYVFLVTPLLHAQAGMRLLAGLAVAASGATLLWAVVRQIVRRRSLPQGAGGPVTLGVVLLGVAAVARARLAVSGAAAGGLWDGFQDAGLLFVGGAVAFAPGAAGERAGGLTVQAARVIAVLVAVAGIAALTLAAAAQPELSAASAPWAIAGIALIGVRFAYAVRADRRYTELLEHEVAAQTRSLMDALAATAAAERNVRLVMEAVPEALFVLDRDSRVTDMNGHARALHWQTGERRGSPFFDLLDTEAAPLLRQHLDAAFGGDLQRFEVQSRRPDGTRGVLAILYAPIRDGWRVARVLASVRDVTDLKRTESQLQQAEKLTAMGQLVSGVAHEMNNPAAIISGFAQTLLLDDLTAEQREMAQMIYDEAARIGRITQNLLAFARAGGRERALVDLNDILRRTFALRSYHLSTLNITVALELDAAEPKIWANPAELQQMLLNLMINAEQALITVQGPRKITLRSASTEQEVRFEVADSGPGIAPEVRARVFDPFFTTKPEGVGTGLGLSICYGIAQQHGGRVWVESELGQGARFVVALPRDAQDDAEHAAEPTTSSGGPGRIRVLLLDDEAALGAALLRYLARHDIDATAVEDGGEALRILKERDFDVIVSDVRMPGMNGREFVAHLRRERPELVGRLIFSTGDGAAPDTAELLETAGVPTVIKPFDLAALEQLIREVAFRPRAA